MSVKSRILQFQTQSSGGESSQPPSLPSFFANANTKSFSTDSNNGLKSLSPSLKPTTPAKIQFQTSFHQTTTTTTTSSLFSTKDCPSTGQTSSDSLLLPKYRLGSSSGEEKLSSTSSAGTDDKDPVPEMKQSKPKMTSLTINLNGTESKNASNESKLPVMSFKSPSATIDSRSSPTPPPAVAKKPSFGTSSIPSPTRAKSPSVFNSTLAHGHNKDEVVQLRKTNLSPAPSSPAQNPVLRRGNASPTATTFDSIDWKTRFEDSEKKRLHAQALAQKATRDYEETLRRYQDAAIEKAKLASKLQGAIGQLDALRQASEATYDEYHKLKKKYDNENKAKAEALGRVDQYNRENRRLKRQSQMIMQQLSDPAFTIPEESELEDSAENDKEIEYLRAKVQELETKIIELESDLERTKLAEFETQESVMLMNDAVHTSKSEKSRLQDEIKALEAENRKLRETLDDTRLELDHVRGKDALDEERLKVAEAELRKVQTEKNILARQSVALMSDAIDGRLLDALTQISDLQTAMAEQKTTFEQQIQELRGKLTVKESHEEEVRIRNEAKICALEEDVKALRKRAEEAEKKLEEGSDSDTGSQGHAPPPPPPPPPMMGMPPPPPPPPPMSSLGSLLVAKAGSLSKTSPEARSKSSSSQDLATTLGQPALDVNDVLTQLQRLKKTSERPPIRKSPEKPLEASPESAAVEEMRKILNKIGRKPILR